MPADFVLTYLGVESSPIAAMMLLGLPLYVCASASVPIAAGLIHAGVLPGAALAFLISGPASNAATLATVWKLFGRRTTLLYLGGHRHQRHRRRPAVGLADGCAPRLCTAVGRHNARRSFGPRGGRRRVRRLAVGTLGRPACWRVVAFSFATNRKPAADSIEP